MIVSLLKEVKDKTGSKYILYYKDGSMQIVNRGTNGQVYEFKGANVISTLDTLSMDNLVTKVVIIGKEDNEGRTSVEDTLNGKLEFGVLQEIVLRDSDKTLAEAQQEAKTLLNERGAPSEKIQVSAPDLPFLRKGYKIKMEAGNLIGYFYITGIKHDATNRTMNLDLAR